jgi:hypothetical protein
MPTLRKRLSAEGEELVAEQAALLAQDVITAEEQR